MTGFSRAGHGLGPGRFWLFFHPPYTLRVLQNPTRHQSTINSIRTGSGVAGRGRSLRVVQVVWVGFFSSIFVWFLPLHFLVSRSANFFPPTQPQPKPGSWFGDRSRDLLDRSRDLLDPIHERGLEREKKKPGSWSWRKDRSLFPWFLFCFFGWLVQMKKKPRAREGMRERGDSGSKRTRQSKRENEGEWRQWKQENETEQERE